VATQRKASYEVVDDEEVSDRDIESNASGSEIEEIDTRKSQSRLRFSGASKTAERGEEEQGAFFNTSSAVH
jgi:hypothetical protein